MRLGHGPDMETPMPLACGTWLIRRRVGAGAIPGYHV